MARTMGTVSQPRPSRIRIETAPDRPGCRVLFDGEDVSNDCLSVTWSLTAGGSPTATIVFVNVEIDAEAAGEDLTAVNVATTAA